VTNQSDLRDEGIELRDDQGQAAFARTAQVRTNPFPTASDPPLPSSNVITLLPLCFASVAPNVAPKTERFPRKTPIVAGVAGI